METVKITLSGKLGADEFSITWDTGQTPQQFEDWSTGSKLNQSLMNNLDALFALRQNLQRRLAGLGYGASSENLMPAPVSVTQFTPPPQPAQQRVKGESAKQESVGSAEVNDGQVRTEKSEAIDIDGWHNVFEIIEGDSKSVLLLTDKAPKYGIRVYKDNPLYTQIKKFGIGPILDSGKVYLNGAPTLRVQVYRSRSGGLRPRQVEVANI